MRREEFDVRIQEKTVRRRCLFASITIKQRPIIRAAVFPEPLTALPTTSFPNRASILIFIRHHRTLCASGVVFTCLLRPNLLRPSARYCPVVSCRPSPLPGHLAMSQDLQTAVISACKEQTLRNEDYRPCVYIGTDYVVKYGYQSDLEPELATREYIFAHAQQTNTPDTPRIPRIVHHFVDQRTLYLVMERIKLQESPPDLPARIQKAIKWLSKLPLPSNYALGPVGRGIIRHKFFKDSEAPFVFPDVVTLDQYIKRAYRLLAVGARQTFSPVSICGERVMFTQSDMDDSNFGVDEHGRTVLMGFSEIGMLPETFVAYTLSSDDAGYLGLSVKSNLTSMAAIAHCLMMVGDPAFGLSESIG